jgi:Na+/melibiose symporter-like transporter
MTGIEANRRGVVSGVLSLSRNLGLITGASVMGAVFALGSGTVDVTMAAPESVAAGMRTTFMVAAILIIVAVGSRELFRRVAFFNRERSEDLNASSA